MALNNILQCLLLASLLLVTVKANEPEFASLLDMVTTSPSINPEVDDESSFSYVSGAVDGPENWGNLNPNWTTCGTGTMQSPINIVDYKVVVCPELGELINNYQSAPAVIRNRGHDIQVQWTGDAGGIMINGDEYKLRQCHWHTASEHALNYKTFKMELHLVHMNSLGDIAVVGILFRLGAADSFLGQLLPYLQVATGEGVDLGVLSPSLVTIPGGQYYRYNGSLTTPPCSENVLWTVMRTRATVSRAQIRALRTAIHDGAAGNARPIQPRRNRPVYFYQPTNLISEI